MCGITGFWGLSGNSGYENTARQMALQIFDRGPDSSGEWADPEAGIALAHRRLSVIDLSPAGAQPMVSPCGRYVISYNGEIYNHLELRRALEQSSDAPAWNGHSDTETLLAAVSAWGLQGALKRSNGMFAFALWDNQERKLYLARDRMGEKPLYYGTINGVFLFGSELSALSAHPKWRGDIDRDALTLYLRHNYVPAPKSIFEGIYKLPAAHFVVISDRGHSVSDPESYWSFEHVVSDGQANPFSSNPEELTNNLDNLLRDAVKMRMAADVPFGAFLSGGYDSSLVVALMQAQSDRPVRTFSIGFDEAGYNEAHHAKAVAAKLGTDHTELYVSSNDVLDVIPKLASIWSEPFADSSQMPTYLVSKLAREQVTVSLSGDGGDELFCGYSRYTNGYNIWKKLNMLPRPVRTSISRALSYIPAQSIDRLVSNLPKRFRYPALGDRLLKLADVMPMESEDEFYRDLISHFKTPEDIVIGGTESSNLFKQPEQWPEVSDFRERMMYFDTKTYLPDDILTKVDRASMAVSLEARVPLLDHRVVEFAWKLPFEYKFRDGQSKWLLRQVLYRYLPREMMERPKMGFGVPIEHWLRGPLRDWAEALLDPKLLREQGFFDPVPIRKMWNEHQSGERRWHSHLWNILMFQSWLEAQNK